MQIRSFDELEAMARARYKARYASVPEPTVINVDAVLGYVAPRRFVVGGIGLRAPPLSYLAGLRLLTAANALSDVIKAGDKAPHQFLEVTRDTAILLIGRALRPISLFRRLRGRWLQVFHRMDAVNLEQFLRSLIYVPDSSTPPPRPTKQVTLDLMDVLQAVMRAWPAGVDPKTRLPRYWAAYLYGAQHLARVRAREDLRITIAFRRAQGADKSEWREWLADETAAAGW